MLYYVTRSYPEITPYNGGGSKMRLKFIHLLKKKKIPVKIVCPNYYSSKLIVEKDYILIPYNSYEKVELLWEYLCLKNDYLSDWAKSTSEVLSKIINKNDYVYCTSGDEIGTLEVGYLLSLKQKINFIINLRDPIFKSIIKGEVVSKSKSFLPHPSRMGLITKIFSKAKYIITSSEEYCNALKIDFPNFKEKFKNNYFGYHLSKSNKKKKIPINNINIVYAGNMGNLQQPHRLLDLTNNLKKFKVIYIGNYSNNKFLKKIEKNNFKYNVEFLSEMSEDALSTYILKNAHMGFLSLQGIYSKYCVPSKLYYYLGLNIPIIGLIGGSAKKIINENNFGIASNNFAELNNKLKSLSINDLNNMIKSIKKNKKKWEMKNKIKEVYNILIDENNNL